MKFQQKLTIIATKVKGHLFWNIVYKWMWIKLCILAQCTLLLVSFVAKKYSKCFVLYELKSRRGKHEAKEWSYYNCTKEIWHSWDTFPKKTK